MSQTLSQRQRLAIVATQNDKVDAGQRVQRMFKLISNDIAQKSFETLHFQVVRGSSSGFWTVNNFKSFFDEINFSLPCLSGFR